MLLVNCSTNTAVLYSGNKRSNGRIDFFYIYSSRRMCRVIYLDFCCLSFVGSFAHAACCLDGFPLLSALNDPNIIKKKSCCFFQRFKTPFFRYCYYCCEKNYLFSSHILALAPSVDRHGFIVYTCQRSAVSIQRAKHRF